RSRRCGCAESAKQRNHIGASVLALVDEIEKKAAPLGAGRTPAEKIRTSAPVVASARNLKKVRREKDPRFVLEGVSLELVLGEITAVVGPNGHGKTTLLEIMAGR